MLPRVRDLRGISAVLMLPRQFLLPETTQNPFDLNCRVCIFMSFSAEG